MKVYLISALAFVGASWLCQYTGISYKIAGVLVGAVINYSLLVCAAFAYLYHIEAKIKKARQ